MKKRLTSRAFARDYYTWLAIGAPALVLSFIHSNLLRSEGMSKESMIGTMGGALKVSMIVLLLLTGFSFGGQPLFGYYYGAGDKQRFGELFRFCLKFISGLALALSAVVFILAKPFTRIFMDNETIIADGALMLRLQVVSMVFVGVVLLMTILFQATGKAVGSSILSVSRQGIVFMVVLFVAANLFGYAGVLFSQAVADFLSAILAVVLFKKLVYKEIFE